MSYRLWIELFLINWLWNYIIIVTLCFLLVRGKHTMYMCCSHNCLHSLRVSICKLYEYFTVWQCCYGVWCWEGNDIIKAFVCDFVFFPRFNWFLYKIYIVILTGLHLSGVKSAQTLVHVIKFDVKSSKLIPQNEIDIAFRIKMLWKEMNIAIDMQVTVDIIYFMAKENLLFVICSGTCFTKTLKWAT